MRMLQYNIGATFKKRQNDVTIFILQSSMENNHGSSKKDTITDSSRIND